MLHVRTFWLKTLFVATVWPVLCTASPAFASNPQQLVFRLDSFNIKLDPAFISDTQSRRVVDMLHAKLVSLGQDGLVRPELARHWVWTTPTVLKITLEPDYRFSRGQLVSSGDVVFSLCRLVQPGAPYGWLFANLKHVTDSSGKKAECTGLRAIDDRTLEIEVSRDPGRLLPALASSTAAIVPAGSTAGEFGDIEGAGPYRIERIVPNSRVELAARPGGPLEPKSQHVTFQLVQDDATAATLFKTKYLDALEITNPRLYRLLVSEEGRLSVPGRLASTDTHQVRMLIFNRASIAKTLGLTEGDAQQWIRAYTNSMDVDKIARNFSPLAVAMPTSYFPARSYARREGYLGQVPSSAGALQVISENDTFSSAVAAKLPDRLGKVTLRFVGLEKSLLISRLLRKEYDVASITLEAMMNHPAYWLAFFDPDSPFVVFGGPLEGLDLNSRGREADIANAAIIDRNGNWFVLFQERHLLALQPNMFGETFLPTGLVNYATMEKRQ